MQSELLAQKALNDWFCMICARMVLNTTHYFHKLFVLSIWEYIV